MTESAGRWSGPSDAHLERLRGDHRVQEQLALAEAWSEWHLENLQGVEISGDRRLPVAIAAFDLVNELHASVYRSIRVGSFAGAYVVLRTQFEALVRGLWVLRAADDTAYEKFLKGWDTLTAENLAKRLRDPRDAWLLNVWMRSKKSLDRFTHVSYQLLARRIPDVAHEHVDPSEIALSLQFSTALSALGVAELARMAGRSDIGFSAMRMLALLYPPGSTPASVGDLPSHGS